MTLIFGLFGSGPPKFKMGCHMTLTMPPLWVLCHPRLGLCMSNLRTKFKVVITAHYIESEAKM